MLLGTVRLASGLTVLRLGLHVLGAAVWVGGQIVLLGMVPGARKLHPDLPKTLAVRFARLSWPAFALLVATGIWSAIVEEQHHPTGAWQVMLGVKVGVVAIAGIGAWRHSASTSRAGIALWGATAAIASLAALALGVFLAG